MRLRSGHSDWMLIQADLVVNGNRNLSLRTFSTFIDRTTESSVREIKVHTWQFASVQMGALVLAKSYGALTQPDK